MAKNYYDYRTDSSADELSYVPPPPVGYNPVAEMGDKAARERIYAETKPLYSDYSAPYSAPTVSAPAPTQTARTTNFNAYTPYGMSLTESSNQIGRTAQAATPSQAGTTYRPPVGTVTSMTMNRPKGPMPTIGTVPEFQAPEWNAREISRMAQAKAAPQVRRLRASVQQAMSRPYENPNVRAMTLREALSGYGQGLESAMAGAESAAQAEYGRRYQTEQQSKAMTYQANIQRMQMEFQAALQDYMKQYTTTQTTRNVYDSKDFGTSLSMR
jgi:hypothetical protein